jgi:hypothetical protein
MRALPISLEAPVTSSVFMIFGEESVVGGIIDYNCPFFFHKNKPLLPVDENCCIYLKKLDRLFSKASKKEVAEDKWPGTTYLN